MTLSVCIGVHGFNFDPASTGKNNPFDNLYPSWGHMVGGPFYGHPWYSVPNGFAGYRRAWAAGFPTRYYYAWSLAEQEGVKLRNLIEEKAALFGEDVTCVVHSLGSRVLMCALDIDRPLPIKRVLILSGADGRQHATKVAARPHFPPVLNVIVKDDKVLEFFGRWLSPAFGREPVIGHSGLPDHPTNWQNVVLADEDDHWDAYRAEYHAPWAAFLQTGQPPELTKTADGPWVMRRPAA